MTAPEAVRSYIAAGSEVFFAELAEWLAIPSISSDPDHAGDVRRSAEWLAAALRRAGFPIVEIWPTGGHPAVYAEWPSALPSARTVLVYGHHDVQPVDPVEAWDTPPFTATVDGDRMYARGASDDKGQVLFHAFGVRAHLAATGRTAPAVTLKLLIEGEEEAGSPHFDALVRRHADRLACDLVVNSDSAMWSADVPTTCTGMRGMVAAQVTFRGPAEEVHSGSFGGAIPNPLTELCRVLGALHDRRSRVTIPGFYDRVVELTGTERDLFARLPFDEREWLSAARSRAAHGEEGFTTLERVWARPTAEVNGMWGGHTGPGMKTIIPREAHAKVSFRLVADQEPAEVRESFRQWLREQVPPGIAAEVEFFGEGNKPCLTPLDHPAVEAVTRSLGRAFDRQVLYTREGGSGPSATLAEVLDAAVVFLAVTLPDDNYHGPNEKAEMPLLLKGAEAVAHLWSELGSEN
ncbi:dipeptidase [Actinomadura sp. 3N508]|uniref:dipeptidase n=1 Tax=Actinomadura sp. 3N508 TaxID=3375153 RepID=UPI00379A92A1